MVGVLGGRGARKRAMISTGFWGARMLRMLLRTWLVLTIAWLMYGLYLHRDKLITFKDRDWALALQYGLNNLVCDIKMLGGCRDLSIPFFQRSQLNETFGLAVTFVGYPLLGLLACLVLAWILHAPKRR